MGDVLICNHCAHERIDPRFVPLVEAARAGMLSCCGGWVREVRLQGSIARGDAQVGRADLDVIALTDRPPTDSENRCLEELAASLGSGTDLVTRFDLEALDVTMLEPFRHFVLSSDSLCIHGDDSLTLTVQSMERVALARLVTPDPTVMLPDYLDWVEELAGADDAQRRFASRIIGKDLLKILRGVLLLRGAPYEVAIPRLAAQVPLVAPEAAGVADRLFALYCEPTTDLDAIRLAAHAANMLVQCLPELVLLRGVEVADRATGETTT